MKLYKKNQKSLAHLCIRKSDKWILHQSTEYLKFENTSYIFSNGPDLPEPLQSHQIILLNSDFGQRSMVIGGMLENSAISKRTFYFFHENQSWVEGPTMIKARLAHAADVVIDLETGQELAIVSGGRDEQNTYLDTTEILVNGKWESGEDQITCCYSYQLGLNLIIG